MNIRRATFDDSKTINRIRNFYIRTSTSNLGYRELSDEEFLQMMYKRDEKTPFYSVENNGEVIGFGSISYFGDKEGYRVTAELGLYLDETHKGSGFGKKLLSFLIDEAKKHGFHSAISRITSENSVSISLHEKAGFLKVAHLKEVGRKFDRFVDVLFFQKIFSNH